MREAIDTYNALQAEKRAAKDKVMEALGQALWNDNHGLPSDEQWATVKTHGIKEGTEGQKWAEIQAHCDQSVTEHPEWFLLFQGRSSEEIVGLISALRQQGLYDDATLGTIYEIASFERQDLTGVVKAKARIPSVGGKK